MIGSSGSSLAAQLHVSPDRLILTVLPHALPELTALFLPLAAWAIASRRGQWHDLLAATVAVAIPVLVAAVSWETYVWPELIRRASPAV